MTIKGCGTVGETEDVILFPGRDPERLGLSSPPYNECGKSFPTFILAQRGIRLCKNCRIKRGIEW